MNKIAILLLVISCSSTVHSQRKFAPLNAVWIFEGWSEGSGWEPNWEGNCQGDRITYTVESEIEIDGKICGIIKSSSSPDSLVVYDEDEIVYFYEDSTFYKLFDYGARTGDTIMSFRPGNAGSFSLKNFFGRQVEQYSRPDTIFTLITDFDTTVINGNKLRRWKTEPIYIYDNGYHPGPARRFETIIENIGSLNGLIGDHDLSIGEGCYGGFVCYQSSQLQYGSYFFPLCDFTSTIPEKKQTNPTIFPNPANGNIRIEGFADNSITKVEVFDLYGRKLLSVNNVEINISNLSSGIYLVVITDNEQKQIGRKVIKR